MCCTVTASLSSALTHPDLPIQATFEWATGFTSGHLKLVSEIAAADATQASGGAALRRQFICAPIFCPAVFSDTFGSSLQALDVIFYGDSEIERLRSTAFGGWVSWQCARNAPAMQGCFLPCAANFITRCMCLVPLGIHCKHELPLPAMQEVAAFPRIQAGLAATHGQVQGSGPWHLRWVHTAHVKAITLATLPKPYDKHI